MLHSAQKSAIVCPVGVRLLEGGRFVAAGALRTIGWLLCFSPVLDSKTIEQSQSSAVRVRGYIASCAQHLNRLHIVKWGNLAAAGRTKRGR